MKKGATVVLLSLLILSAGSSRRAPTTSLGSSEGWNSADTIHLRREAFLLFQAGEYLKAAQLYRLGAGNALKRLDYFSAARLLNNLGGAEFALVRYTDALPAFLHAREFAERAGDPITMTTASYHLASLYTQMNELNLATEAAARGLAISTVNGPSGDRAALMILLIWLHAKRGDIEQARKSFSEGLHLADLLGSSTLQAHAWDHLGLAYLDRGDLLAAEEALIEAYRLRLMSQDKTITSSYLKLGTLRKAQGNLTSALVLLNRAAETIGGSPVFEPIWNIYWQRGIVREAGGNSAGAIIDFRSALDFAARWRLGILPANILRTSSEVRLHKLCSSFIQAAGDLYLNTRSAALAQEAFQAAEQNRAAAWRIEATNYGKTRLPEEYFQLLARLRALETSLLAGDSLTARRAIERIRLELAEAEAKAGLVTLPARRTHSAQTGSAKSKTLFSFYLGEPRSWRWEVTAGRTVMIALPARTVIEERARQFRQAVEGQDPRSVSFGSALYNDLFSGLSPASESSSCWTLVLDQALYEVPIPALVVAVEAGRPVYLVERRAIKLAPASEISFSLAPDSLENRQFIGVGDPVYNTADPRWDGPRRSADSPRLFRLLPRLEGSRATASALYLPRLAGSGYELSACARVWDEPGSKLLTGMDASLPRLTAAVAGQPAIIHLATHVIPSASANQAHIALSLQAGGDTQLLTADDIAAFRTQAGIVALSGCSSGRAQALPAVGLMGLTRAWLLAGASNVVASLWDTPDDTGQLFLSFYRHLRQTGAAEALGAAQVEMLRSGTWRAQPKYWAAYFTLGRS